MQQIGIIGSGSWAIAMLKMLTNNPLPKQLHWWVRNPENVAYLKAYKHHPNYLSAVTLDFPEGTIQSKVKDVIQKSDILILNTPAAFLKDALNGITKEDLQGKVIVSAIKGIVPQENLIVGDYLQQNYQIPIEKIVVVGGPCHAEEVAQERLSYLTIASQGEANAENVAHLLRTRYIQTSVSDDIYGTEYAAVLKNIYAIAVGISRGIGYGDNFQAVLISNALREMAQFVNAVHPIERNIMESAYLGDLLVTGYSQFSRNRTFGHMIGKGYQVQTAQLEMNMIAEGYYASSCIQEICARHNLSLPICDAVYQILYRNSPVGNEISRLAQLLN
jgi:glycerol-3-phosphate dehydrogenase (NAD(P)+)